MKKQCIKNVLKCIIKYNTPSSCLTKLLTDSRKKFGLLNVHFQVTDPSTSSFSIDELQQISIYFVGIGLPFFTLGHTSLPRLVTQQSTFLKCWGNFPSYCWEVWHGLLSVHSSQQWEGKSPQHPRRSPCWHHNNRKRIHPNNNPPKIEALFGGVYSPCSLRHFTLLSLLPSIFRRSLLLTNFHCSFFISPCSLLLFNFSSCSLIILLLLAPFPKFLLLPAASSKF